MKAVLTVEQYEDILMPVELHKDRFEAIDFLLSVCSL